MADAGLQPVTSGPLIASRQLAAGAQWRIREVLCQAGPDSPVAQECHEWTGVAVVTSGTFTYRSDAGAAMLSPGSILLVNGGACFECGHEHGAGDVCVSFQFSPAFVEKAFSQFQGNPPRRFRVHTIPPLPTTIPLTVRATARNAGVVAGDELAACVLDTALRMARQDLREGRPDVRDTGKVAALVRDISLSPDEPWSLTLLSARSELDEFRLLRAFKRVVGTTPYQYVLRQRLDRAARMLLEGRHAIHDVALTCGFNDLSEFNRRFRSHLGVAPTRFRKELGAGR